MKIHESAENYLEAILVLSQNKTEVRSIDVANYMNFSKPSVSVAMKQLRQNGYIQMDANGFLTLLPAGREIAEMIYERHCVIAKILMALGVDEETASSENSGAEEQDDIPALDFTLTDQFGNTHTLADYEGKTILLNFWATWCGPCQMEMPDLQALYEEWGENEGDLVVLGIASPVADGSLYPVDDKSAEEIGAWLDEQGYTYPVLMDTTGELFLGYGVYSFPTTFMIDKEGNVFGYLNGSMSREIMDSIVEQTMTGQRVNG